MPQEYNKGKMKSRILLLAFVGVFPFATFSQTSCESLKSLSYTSTEYNDTRPPGQNMKMTACSETNNKLVSCAQQISDEVKKLSGLGDEVDATANGVGTDAKAASTKAGGDSTGYDAAQLKAMRGNEILRGQSQSCEAEAKKIEPLFEIYKKKLKPFEASQCKSVNFSSATAKASEVAKSEVTKKQIETKCALVTKSAQSNAAIFAKNALIVGGIAAGVGALAYGATKLFGKDGDKPSDAKASEAACTANKDMEFKDGVCKSKTALATCPEGFTKDKDGYCVMKDTNGNPITTGTSIQTASGNGSGSVRVPNGSNAKNELSDKDKALAALAAGESGGGSGSGSDSGGGGSGSGGGGSGGGGSGAAGSRTGASAGGSGGGGSGGYGGSGSDGGEEDKEGVDGAGKEAVDNPLKWRNSKSTDRDLPISRRKRLKK